ncbi:hypothetical protein N7563_22075 [Leclercia adecarboxylata ATCC 23216 = NBRC 102595]|nr:hypothetical protein [Leclercia adecarboxylata ATCC 23216 = NBRC 102595]
MELFCAIFNDAVDFDAANTSKRFRSACQDVMRYFDVEFPKPMSLSKLHKSYKRNTESHGRERYLAIFQLMPSEADAACHFFANAVVIRFYDAYATPAEQAACNGRPAGPGLSVLIEKAPEAKGALLTFDDLHGIINGHFTASRTYGCIQQDVSPVIGSVFAAAFINLNKKIYGEALRDDAYSFHKTMFDECIGDLAMQIHVQRQLMEDPTLMPERAAPTVH